MSATDFKVSARRIRLNGEGILLRTRVSEPRAATKLGVDAPR